MNEPAPKRRYDSPVRRRQAAATRARIVAAGAELLRGYPIWNWGALTVRAVAERAEVNERTVYRHFANERALRDAVMAQLELESGADLDNLAFDDLQRFSASLLEFVSSFPVEPRTGDDPTLLEASQRRRQALLDAVTTVAGAWSETDRTLAAAMLDVLWSVTSYERLVADWDLDEADAISAVTWAIGLLQGAVRDGRRPTA